MLRLKHINLLGITSTLSNILQLRNTGRNLLLNNSHQLCLSSSLQTNRDLPASNSSISFLSSSGILDLGHSLDCATSLQLPFSSSTNIRLSFPNALLNQSNTCINISTLLTANSSLLLLLDKRRQLRLKNTPLPNQTRKRQIRRSGSRFSAPLSSNLLIRSLAKHTLLISDKSILFLSASSFRSSFSSSMSSHNHFIFSFNLSL